MDEKYLRDVLAKYKANKISLEELMVEIKTEPYLDIGFARVDHHRSIRQSMPEVIFCEGKTKPQITKIAKELIKRKNNLLATRANKEVYKALKKDFPAAKYDKMARTVTLVMKTRVKKEGVVIVTAGTADIPVAQEACIVADMMGNRVETIYDVGVAGLHRLLKDRKKIFGANVLVVVAGMDGVLPSVIGGIVDVPIIAVPTSTGYGANFAGIAPLLTMLNSCAAGVSVVNIDNGFGAGYMAGLINLKIHNAGQKILESKDQTV